MRGNSWGQGRSLGPSPQFPCQQVHALPAGQVCGWDRELFSTGLSSGQNPRSRGGGNLITEINCPFPGSVYSWGQSSCRTPRGNPRCGQLPIDQMGAEAWGPEAGGPKPLGCAAQSPPCCRDGGSGRSRDKLRQEQSESPPCVTSGDVNRQAPTPGSPAEVPGGRQGGARGHHG